MDGATGVVSTRAAVIAMLLMADHGETVEIAVVAVAIGTAARGASARMDAAAAAAVVGAAVIGISIGGRAAISLPRTRRVAVGARARDVEKAKGGAMGIEAMRIAVIPVGATEIVATSTAVKEIVLRVAVVKASAPTAIVGMEIGATATVVRAIAPRVAVVTVTAAMEIALKATAARAVATSIAMPIVRVTSTVAAAMPANPVNPSVRMSKLIVPSTRRRHWQVARVMLA